MCLTAQKLKVLHYVSCRRAVDQLFKFDVQYNNFSPSMIYTAVHLPFYCKCNGEALKDELYPECGPLSIIWLIPQNIFKSLFILEMSSYMESDEVYMLKQSLKAPRRSSSQGYATIDLTLYHIQGITTRHLN